MDVIFFVPKAEPPTGIPILKAFNECYSYENLGVGYLLAALHKNNIEFEVYDFNFESRPEIEILNEALRKCPKIIGITVHQYSFLYAKYLAKMIRKMNFDGKIVIGGQFPTLSPEFIFENCPEIDHILLGECDNTIVEYVHSILKGFDSKKVVGLLSKDSNLSLPFVYPKVSNLDDLPLPYRYGYKYLKEKNIPSVSGSRGCPYGNCTFCSTAAYYKKIYGTNIWRYRSSKSIYNELKYLYTTYQCNYFVFADETVFNTNLTTDRIPNALKQLAAEGINMNFLCDCRVNDISVKKVIELKKYGLKRIFVGFESNDPKYLKFIKKGTTPRNNQFAVKILKQLEVEIIPGFIPFHPHATLESIKDDFRFMVEVIGYNSVHKYVKRLLPEINTPFFKDLLTQGNLYGDFPFYKYKFHDSRVQKIYDTLNTLIFKDKMTDEIKLYNVVMNAK